MQQRSLDQFMRGPSYITRLPLSHQWIAGTVVTVSTRAISTKMENMTSEMTPAKDVEYEKGGEESGVAQVSEVQCTDGDK